MQSAWSKVNAVNKLGDTALHGAAWKGQAVRVDPVPHGEAVAANQTITADYR